MSLEECPACQKVISIKARSCPNCGEPLRANWAKQVARNRPGDRPTKFQSLLVAVVLGTLVPGGLMYGFGSISNNDTTEPSATQMAIPPKELTQQEIKEKAQQAARDRAEAEERRVRNRAEEQQQKRQAYLDRVQREIKSFESFDVSKFTGTNFGFLAVNTVFQVWANMIEEAKGLSLNSDDRKIVANFRNGAIEVQKWALPKIRDAYGPHMRKLLWGKDVTAKTFGDGYRIVEFVGGLFASNRNIKVFNDELWETFRILRFKQVRYKWFSDAKEYTYYDVESPNDTELIIWGDGTFKRVEYP